MACAMIRIFNIGRYRPHANPWFSWAYDREFHMTGREAFMPCAMIRIFNIGRYPPQLFFAI